MSLAIRPATSTNVQSSTATAIEGNRRAYRRSDTVDLIGRRTGWIDAAERILVNMVADEVRSMPILDIGVGGGRTAWMLRPLSRDYVAVDYSPEMVETCRRLYPGLDVRECDARDLSMFADDSFALVVFSFNGIDVIDHEGRLTVFSEIHRVLRPGGLLLYSTSNKHGPLYRWKPWTLRQARVARLDRFLLRLPVALPRYWRTYRNWWKLRRYAQDHGSWATCASRAYEFRILVHWTLPSTEREVLESLGFAIEATMGRDGDPVDADTSPAPYFYVLARKSRGG